MNGSRNTVWNSSISELRLVSPGAHAEHGSAAVAVQRLDDDVLVLGAEALHVVGVARDQRRRHQVEEIEHEHLLGRVAHVGRIVDHQRLGMDALEQVRGGDVGHVERRVLAQQDHVQLAEIHGARI